MLEAVLQASGGSHEVARRLLANMVLTGGVTAAPGFVCRLVTELSAMLHKQAGIKPTPEPTVVKHSPHLAHGGALHVVHGPAAAADAVLVPRQEVLDSTGLAASAGAGATVARRRRKGKGKCGLM